MYSTSAVIKPQPVKPNRCQVGLNGLLRRRNSVCLGSTCYIMPRLLYKQQANG